MNIARWNFRLLTGGAIVKDHDDRVFALNEKLARRLEDVAGLGLVKKVVHPCLGDKAHLPYAVSPFVIFILSEGRKSDVTFLKRVMERQAKDSGLLFQSGSSFGFRSHRFEVNDYHNENEPSFRIAMGSFDGPSVDLIIRLIEVIADFDTFEELRDAFPEIKHPDD